MASATEENYLKAMLKLSRDNGECTVSGLSNLLNVSTPTANSMIKKLAEKKWIDYEKYKPLHLTSLGKKMAALVLRKHRLTEMFLVESMGFGWEEVHEIAEQIEHINSEKFFDRMDVLLGHPSVDPHGSPIPHKDGSIQHKKYVKLSKAQIGKSYRLASLDQSSRDFLKFLNKRKIKLGLTLSVISIEEFDGSLVVRYGGNKNETLSKTVCQKLLVEEV
ncbi:MAG: DtxR family Mn-dependent transcriptional regulator [Psychromonas sp.]|jgi:DtxR family Mn-dependent transcriptional regulator